MSIRLRFTLLYNIILAVTLAIFGFSIYAVQMETTYNALQKDLKHSSDRMEGLVARAFANSGQDPFSPPNPPPTPEGNSGSQVFRELPEREVLRVLDPAGALLLSPLGRTAESLPLSAQGLKTVQAGNDWWQTSDFQGQAMLIYNRPIFKNGTFTYILQVARPLTERNRSLEFLGTTFLVASLLTILVAFGIGWIFSGMMLQPIQRLTQTAQAIGEERDFTRRVAYTGPQDEVGQLATTFNSMLARLQEAYQKLAHSLEMQRNFVADVSHELRTPLTTLRGNLGLLQREPPIPADERADITSDMVYESDRLIRLVNELLVLARADAGRNLSKESVAILPILEETCRQAHQLNPVRRISLEAADIAFIGDRDALKQVILIALDNALKHSSGEIMVSAAPRGGQAEIRVQDSGEGIPPDRLARVFDRFYRGEESATIPGFGLGLPIAKALVEGMGGRIQIESEPGKGSLLTIQIPLAATNSYTSEPPVF